MPEMNGPALAEILLASFPGMKRLFMSGYAPDVIGPYGVLRQRVNFIQKPFIMSELSEKLQQVLAG
jgi:FixJ family two-component response regulator